MAALALALGLTSCADVVLDGQDGNLRTVDRRQYAGRTRPDTPRFLQGGMWCPVVECGAACGEGEPSEALAGIDLGDCYVPSASGALVAEDGCWRLADTGNFELRFESQACELAGADVIGDDRVAGQIVAGAAAVAVFERWPEDAVEIAGNPTMGAPLDGWKGEPQSLMVVVGPEVRVPMLLLDADGTRIAFDRRAVSIAVETVTGDPPELVYDSEEAELVLSPESPSRSLITLNLPGESWSVGTLEVVEPSAITQLQLAAVLGDDGVPYGARALLTDDQGRIAIGGDVEWTISGDLHPSRTVWSSTDHAELAQCTAPSRQVTTGHVDISARLASLEDVLSIDYMRAASDEPDLRDWRAHADCPIVENPGCICALGRGHAAPGREALGALALLLVASFARRRKAGAAR